MVQNYLHAVMTFLSDQYNVNKFVFKCLCTWIIIIICFNAVTIVLDIFLFYPMFAAY